MIDVDRHPFSCRIAGQVGQHAFIQISGFELGGVAAEVVGNPAWKGNRHDWNIKVGEIAPEILEWLRADPALTPGTAEWAALGVQFTGKSNSVKTEANRKWIKGGSMGRCCSKTMCQLDLTGGFAAARLQAWLAAWRSANEGALKAMVGSSQKAVSALGEEDIGNNGHHMLDTPWVEWFCSCGELCIMQAGCEASGFWTEPLHQDGGASVVHIGITLYDRRDLRFIQGKDMADVSVDNGPGTVYFGQVTGAEHQVHHKEALDCELLNVPAVGLCSVTAMLRSGLFPYNRARVRGTTPSPQAFFCFG